MIKEIKYNRTVGEFNRLLDSSTTTDEFDIYIPFYNVEYFNNDNPIYYIENKHLIINYFMFFENNLTFGLDYKTIVDLIIKKHNMEILDTFTLVDNYGHYINYDKRN